VAEMPPTGKLPFSIGESALRMKAREKSPEAELACFALISLRMRRSDGYIGVERFSDVWAAVDTGAPV
jgi:hypothetical protein